MFLNPCSLLLVCKRFFKFNGKTGLVSNTCPRRHPRINTVLTAAAGAFCSKLCTPYRKILVWMYSVANSCFMHTRDRISCSDGDESNGLLKQNTRFSDAIFANKPSCSCKVFRLNLLHIFNISYACCVFYNSPFLS